MVLKKETNKQKKPKKKHLSTFPLGIDEFLL